MIRLTIQRRIPSADTVMAPPRSVPSGSSIPFGTSNSLNSPELSRENPGDPFAPISDWSEGSPLSQSGIVPLALHGTLHPLHLAASYQTIEDHSGIKLASHRRGQGPSGAKGRSWGL